MKGTVFYSWQSDSDAKVCRYVIRDALEKALKGSSPPLDCDEATRGEPGSPEIFGTILKKIANASLVVIDLSIVGRYATKCIPNPNVLIEYGYALRSVGAERIVSVLNDHFGNPEELPFDLKARAIRVRYTLPPDSGNERRKQVTKNVAGRLRSELQLAINSSLWAAISSNARLAVELFVTESVDGAFQKPSLGFSEFCSRLALSSSEAREVVDELEGRKFVKRRTALGNPILSVSPTDEMFWKFDRLVKDWNSEQDALFIAERLIACGRLEGNQIVSSTLATEIGW